MKTILDFVKTTVVGGVLFLLPLVVAILLLREAVRLTARVLEPLAQALPIKSVVGFAVVNLLAILALLLVAFLAGLLARTQPGIRFVRFLERIVLRHIPGYTLYKSMTRSFGIETNSDVAVALAFIDDSWLLSFVIERHASGLLTVFVPSAPTPMSGMVYFLPEDRVRRVDAPVGAALRCLMQLGVGSAKLLDGVRLPSPGGPRGS
jgi:uncharacterized membrane protein